MDGLRDTRHLLRWRTRLLPFHKSCRGLDSAWRYLFTAHPPPSLFSTTTPSAPSYLQKRLYRLESTWLQPSTRSLGLTSSASSGPRRPSLGGLPLCPCAQRLRRLLSLQLRPLPPSSKNGCTVWSRRSLSPSCFASSAPSALVDLLRKPLGFFPFCLRGRHLATSRFVPSL
jgi:hypothetical protein